jgi:hypothetical protein
MNCQSAQENFSLYLYGELDFQTEDLLEEHLAQCPVCAALLEREREWHASASNLAAETPAEVSMDLVARCRRDLSRSLRFMDPPRRPSRWTLLLEALDISPSHWATQIAAASLLVGLGFAAARILDRQPLGSLLSLSNQASVLGSGADTRLRAVQSVTDPSKLALVFEDVHTRTVTVHRDDPETVRILGEAATSQLSEDPALRADVLDSLRGLGDPAAVKAVLIVAARDPNPGLRLKALDVLDPDALRNQETLLTLVRMLRSDQNAGVRMKVASLLTQVQKLPSDPSVAGTLQEIREREPRTCDLMHCQQMLRDINASVETY